jgi:hypothetical protein
MLQASPTLFGQFQKMHSRKFASSILHSPGPRPVACTCLTPGVESRKPPVERSKGDESTKEEVSVGRKRDDEGLQDWEKDRDQDRQEEHDERVGVRQEEHDEREQVRREEREDRKQAREDERETRRRSP